MALVVEGWVALLCSLGGHREYLRARYLALETGLAWTACRCGLWQHRWLRLAEDDPS